MKANVITVCIPAHCTKKCEYCISNMTFPIKNNEKWFDANLHKAVKLAERASVSHCLITSKGEPINNPKMLEKVLHAFSDFFTEIQTHYDSLCLDINIVGIFYRGTLNLQSISVDNVDDLQNIAFWSSSTSYPWVIRLAVVLTESFKGWQILDFVNYCKSNGIRELTIRNPTIPENYLKNKLSLKTVNWINQNIYSNTYIAIARELTVLIESKKAKFIRDLQFGSKVYDINGISFVHMDYCVEDQNGDVIRSLIYQGDGNIYTTWNYPGSIMF